MKEIENSEAIHRSNGEIFSTQEKQRREAGRHLRSYRDGLSPSMFDIEIGKRRRVSGLTREEAAQFSNLSTETYTKIETGRYKSLNLKVLDSIAMGLKMSTSQHQSLVALAGLKPAFAPPASFENSVPPSLQRFLDNIDPALAYVINSRWDIVGWNRTASLAIKDFENTPVEERNLIYQLFIDPDFKKLVVNREAHARHALRYFKFDYSQYQYETPSFRELVDMLTQSSSEFRAWWNDDLDVDRTPENRKELNNPVVGILAFEQTAYFSEIGQKLRIIIHSPLDDQTIEKIESLKASHDPLTHRRNP